MTADRPEPGSARDIQCQARIRRGADLSQVEIHYLDLPQDGKFLEQQMLEKLKAKAARQRTHQLRGTSGSN